MNLFKSLYTLLKQHTRSTNLMIDTSKKQINTQIILMPDLFTFNITSFINEYKKSYIMNNIQSDIFNNIYKSLLTQNYIVLKFDNSLMINIYMKNKYEEDIEICIEFLNKNQISEITIYYNQSVIVSKQFPNDNSD